MYNNINLLSNKNSEVLRKKKRVVISRVAAIGAFIALVLLSVAVFMLNKQEAESIEIKERDSILNNINILQEKEVKLRSINDRLQGIREILKERKDYYGILTTVLQKIPDGASIEKLEVDSKAILLTVSSNSLVPIDGLINNLIDMAVKKEIITKLVLESLTLDSKKGNYLVNIKANL